MIREILKGRLARAALWSYVLKGVSTGIGFLNVILLARILGAGEYGAYAYAMTWANLLCVPVLLGFDKLLIREVAVYHGAERWDRLRGIVRVANGVSLGLALGAVALAGLTVWLLRHRLQEEFLVPLMLALALVPVLVLSQLRQAAMIGLRRAVAGQLPELLVRPLLFLGLVVAVLLFREAARGAVMAVLLNGAAAAVAFAVGGVLLGRALRRETRPAAPTYRLRKWLGSAAPLALLAGLQIINARIDVVMLGTMKGAASVGVYSVAIQCSGLIAFILYAVNTATGPVIARLYSRNDLAGLQRLVTRGSRVMLACSLPVAALLIVFAGPILSLFGEEFRNGAAALMILSAGQLVNAGMGSVGLILSMTRYEKVAAGGAALGIVVNVVLNLLLIPRFGMVGAAIATVSALAFWNTLYAYWIYRHIGIVPTVIRSTRKTPDGSNHD